MLLLDEIVMPNSKVEWYVTQTDLAMMAQCASMERTESEWEQLLASVNLKIRKIITYTHTFRLSLIVATI